MSCCFKNLVPEKPVHRALGLAATALAGCGTFFLLAGSGALISWSLPLFRPWQVLTFASWAINTAAIICGGRLDGGGKGLETAEGSKDVALPVVRYFMPAGWAFTIWGSIIVGETALASYQALPLDSVAAAADWLLPISPWLASAFLLQSCWCLSFREWARDSGLLWFPAVLLAGTAVCLGGAHQVLRGALMAGDMSTFQYIVVHLPISLHFGWVSCATLVNLNNYIALVPRFSDQDKLGFSLASIVGAVSLAVIVTGKTGDSVYAAVVAWALSAVASQKGWGAMKGRVQGSTLKTQAVAAKVGAAVCVVAALAPFVMTPV